MFGYNLNHMQLSILMQTSSLEVAVKQTCLCACLRLHDCWLLSFTLSIFTDVTSSLGVEDKMQGFCSVSQDHRTV